MLLVKAWWSDESVMSESGEYSRSARQASVGVV